MVRLYAEHPFRKAALALLSCLCLPTLAGCGDGQSAAEATPVVPETIRIVDETLAKYYDDHFENIQGDYAVANRIAGEIQRVVEAVPFRSKPALLGLIEDAEALIHRPEEDEYRALVAEWNRVRPGIRLAEQ